MFSRLIDAPLRENSSLSHYFNIVLIGAIYASLLIWLLNGEEAIGTLVKFYAGLISLSSLPELSTAAYFHIFTVLVFIIYMPFTHMTHMFMKYFLYHSVRWEDEPNIPGSELNKKLTQQLSYPISWSAKHIGADGKKNWGDIVSDIPEDM
jgi:nitrate reductase gamma subunit